MQPLLNRLQFTLTKLAARGLLLLLAFCQLSAVAWAEESKSPSRREIVLRKSDASGKGGAKLTVHHPSKPNGTAMVICPGGGYRNLMMSYEGVDIARYLNKIGVHAYVLKYRLTHQGDSTKQEGQDVRQLAGEDGQQAIRLVRSGAINTGIKPDRIGMIGFSAGGGVTLSSVFGPADGRPDFAVPVYTGGRLTGSSSIIVPDNAPPLCILTAANDQIIPWQQSMDLFVAWKKAGYLAELHIFQMGRHGFVEKGGGADHFMDRLQEWMKVNGWLDKGP